MTIGHRERFLAHWMSISIKDNLTRAYMTYMSPLCHIMIYQNHSCVHGSNWISENPPCGVPLVELTGQHAAVMSCKPKPALRVRCWMLLGASSRKVFTVFRWTRLRSFDLWVKRFSTNMPQRRGCMVIRLCKSVDPLGPANLWQQKN